jgi:hypothetical protein
MADTETAKRTETELVKAALADQDEAMAEQREGELEATEEHEEDKAGIVDGAHGDTLVDLNDFWIRWLSENNAAMIADLDQVGVWLDERRRLFEMGFFDMPLGGVPPGGGGTDDEEEETTTDTGGGGTQATLEQLQNLAISHATTLGLLTDQYMDLIMSLPYDDLVQLVDDLQQMVNASGLDGQCKRPCSGRRRDTRICLGWRTGAGTCTF